MPRSLPLLAILVSLILPPASQAAVGFQHFTIPDPQGAPLETGVWYPTDAVAAPTPVELFRVDLATDAPVRGSGLPLVIISHGNGGSYAGHLDTAMALAEAGFVVASVTHTGDNWRDQSAATRVWERPRHLKLLTDHLLGASRDHGHIDPERVGAFGFSAGGFTVLAAAGGEADLSTVGEHCQAHPQFYDCQLVKRSGVVVAQPSAWPHDARIRALVVAAPAIGYSFGAAGLAQVRQPVQLWRAADDEVLPHPYYAEAVRVALPAPPEIHVAAGARHYDFLAPCSPALARAAPPICASAAGFDRSAFHDAFNRQVVDFFRRTLSTP